MGHGVGCDVVLGALQPPVERGPEALGHHVLRCIEPGRELRDRPLERGQEQAFLRPEVQEDGPLGDPDLRRRCPRRVRRGTRARRNGPWRSPRCAHGVRQRPASGGLDRRSWRNGNGKTAAGPDRTRRTRETFRLAGNRSSQPPSASRALVPQATSAPSRLDDRTARRRLARRRSSHLPPGGSPFDVPPRQRAPRPGRPCGVPRRARRVGLAALATPIVVRVLRPFFRSGVRFRSCDLPSPSGPSSPCGVPGA